MRPARFVLLLALLSTVAYADSDRSPRQSVELLAPEPSVEAAVAPQDIQEIRGEPMSPHAVTGAPLYQLNWLSVNGGGARSVVGTNFRLGVTAGQEAAAEPVTGTHFALGMGYWYGARGGACPIILPGDVNVNGLISSSDIIVLVNYVFKAGPAPQPCTANGDVNCNGAVSSSDIIYIVNKVFRAGPPPCDICTMVPTVWSCP